MLSYVRNTWRTGRAFDLPVSFIISETLRGMFTHVNAITEI